jgi:sulfur carrier protein ThiS
MKVLVKLFSVLRDDVPGYNSQTGIEAVIPEGATVADLLGHIGIPMSRTPVVTCAGRILKPSDACPEGGTLHIFQPVAGG